MFVLFNACRGRPVPTSEWVTRGILQDSTGSDGFLAGTLPLEVVAATPSKLTTAEMIEVEGVQALTVRLDTGGQPSRRLLFDV